MIWNNKELTLELTQEWHGDRYDDGRPRVSDALLKRLSVISCEEAYIAMFNEGYHLQFEGDFNCIHRSKTLIGRAVTAVMVPSRPDIHQNMLKYGRSVLGYKGYFNQWVIDSMQENDILVVDMCDRIEFGTFVGGNLSTAIHARAKQGGAVIWGGIRDYDQIVGISDFNLFYRGIHPSPIGDVMLTGINTPTRIGRAVCLPGDVVHGTDEGVVFIPPHLAEMVATKAEKTRIRDMFGFERLGAGVYTTAQIDQTWWTEDIMADFINWFATSEKTVEYRYLDWSEELEMARNPIATAEFDGMVDMRYH